MPEQRAFGKKMLITFHKLTGTFLDWFVCLTIGFKLVRMLSSASLLNRTVQLSTLFA